MNPLPLEEWTDDALRLRKVAIEEQRIALKLRDERLRKEEYAIDSEILKRNGYVEVERGMWQKPT